ncbi:MAG: sterol desaturase family protein [Proteobacteria bacterium]|nr:sterol desaturase family protein [Pseudomonadota bacterium]MBU1612173.1 sterol desaturase family protein [Pseudomonadota bacterium]
MPFETWLRFGSFALVLVCMLGLETLFPKRPLTAPRTTRALNNLAVLGLGTLLVRLFPILPVALATLMHQGNFGLFEMLDLPAWVEIPTAMLLLDLLIYWQHRLFHVVRPLWRIHRMHHADVDIDTTTALRFHPLEIALSMLIKLAAVALLAPSPLAVLLFEVSLNGCALFNHANLALPATLDRWLRLVLVTPDMHRVHHSTDMREANKNLGFNLPWWDRLFGTYQAQPALGHQDMHIGMNLFRDPVWWRLPSMLLIPFK